MTDRELNQVTVAGDPESARLGEGASGQQWAVQTAQRTDVNDPEAKIPANVDVEESKAQIKAVIEQEAGTMPTTHGYVIDESGNLDNFAVEPPMEVVKS